MKNVLLMLAR